MSTTAPLTPGSDPSWEPFRRYLAASVTDTHPTARNVRDFLNRASKVAKEIAYQQRRFLEFGKASLDTAPWVTYLTCIKHPCVAEQYRVTAASFPEISDKSYWDDLAMDVDATRAVAKARLDERTTNDVEQLCRYQVLGNQIAKLPTTLHSLRELRSRFGNEVSYKPWVIAWVSLILLEFLLAGAFGAAEPHSAEQKIYRVLLIIVGIAAGISLVMAWITGFRNATQRELRKSYSKQFEAVVAPCMRLAGADPADGFDKLDYAEEVAQYVRKTYDDLKAKLLTI